MNMMCFLASCLLAQCPGGLCPPGVCTPCGDVLWESEMRPGLSPAGPVYRYVSNSGGPCQQTAHGTQTAYGVNSEVIAQLAAQQERLVRTVQQLSEDMASIRWQQFRPVQRAAPIAAPSKMTPTPETFASPQASPQAPVPYDLPPPATRKSPPLPSPAPPQSMPPPQASFDAAEQWQRALAAGRVRRVRGGDPSKLRGVEGPDRTPFTLD